MSYVLFFSDLTSLTGFLVAFRSINVLKWSKRNVLIRQFMVSKRNKLKLACDLKSLSGNVIMQVLFLAAVIALLPVQ